jgi:predicted metal-dependent phosphoesterase TrpH
MEVSAVEGHILALGIEEGIEPLRPAIEIVEDIQDKGGLAVAAHPYHAEGVRDLVYCLDIDGIEVLNARAMGGNGNAQIAAERLNLPGTAGSDAHRKGDLGRVYSLIDCEKNVASILDAIEKKKLVNEGKSGLTAITSSIARKI